MPLSTFDFELLRKLVKDRSGIVLGIDKQYLLESRLLPLARVCGLDSLEALCNRLRQGSDGPLHRQVVEAMTTNETLFFRDGHPFETLTRLVLSDLMSKRQASKKLAIWCAASSTGQEPYSIAMAIKEALPSLLSWQLKIIATDLSTEVLARAKAGVYSALEVSRGLPLTHLNRYFVKAGADWQIKEDLRKMIEFRPLNLLESYGNLGTQDVVLMRNVLIYFDLPTKREILGKVRRLMAPDGYFFLGGAETTMNVDDAFERIPQDRGGVYRIRPGSTIGGALAGLPKPM